MPVVSPPPASTHLIDASTSTTAAPSAATDGTDAVGGQWAVFTFESNATTSADFVVWTYSKFTGMWAVRKDLGAQGTVTVVSATDGGTDRLWVFLGGGVTRIDVQLTALTGGAGTGASAWVEFTQEQTG